MSKATVLHKLIVFIRQVIVFIVNNFLAIGAFAIVLLLALPIGFYGMYLYIEPELPSMDELQKPEYKMPLQVYTYDEYLIGEFGHDMSLPITYDELPQKLINAFLAAEDDKFFNHDGISIKGLGRAVTQSISDSGQQTGGSTITMQVAKNYFLTPERTIKRKLTELFLARRIEQNLTKEEILTLYVNKIYLGENAYGVKAAAKRYYSKTLGSLTTAQMAMIAGLPKAPSSYNPAVNPERAMERRNWILGRMLSLGYIDQPEYDAAIKEPNLLTPYQTTADKSYPYLAEWARYELVQQYGRAVMSSGWRVRLTINSKRQDMADNALKKGLLSYSQRHGWHGAEANEKDRPLSSFHRFDNNWPAKVVGLKGNHIFAELQDGREVDVVFYGARRFITGNQTGYFSSNVKKSFKIGDILYVTPTRADQQGVWHVVKVPKVQGALVALDPDSGALQAMVGGYDFYHSKFNRVTQGWRQPGSIIKPFVYTLALEQGYRPNSLISDDKLRVGSWNPKNADGRYLGKIPLRTALYLSRNLVSIRLLQSVGIAEARQFLSQFGMTKSKLPSNLTLALGTGQVLPLQMATGYAAFANGGHRVQPHFIDSIYDFNGNLIYLANPSRACALCYNKKVEAELKNDTKSNNLDVDDKNAITTVKKESNDLKPTGKTIKSANDAEPVDLLKVQDASAEKDRLYEFSDAKLAAEQAPRIISADVAYDMAGILNDVVMRGTGKKARSIGRTDIGGKTGTTNDAKDAWFAGFHPTLVAVAWVGFDKPETLGRREYGGVAALPIWTRFMGPALKGQPHQWVSVKNVSKSRKQKSKIMAENEDGELVEISEMDDSAGATQEDDGSKLTAGVVETDFKMPPKAYFIRRKAPKPKYVRKPSKSHAKADNDNDASITTNESNGSFGGGLQSTNNNTNIIIEDWHAEQKVAEKPDFNSYASLTNEQTKRNASIKPGDTNPTASLEDGIPLNENGIATQPEYTSKSSNSDKSDAKPKIKPSIEFRGEKPKSNVQPSAQPPKKQPENKQPKQNLQPEKPVTDILTDEAARSLMD